MTAVLVIGAGVSGLACGYELARRNVSVQVVEAEARAGGVVGTLEQDGFLFETGPNTVQASSRNFRELCGELGLAERLVASHPEAKVRYLFHGGELRALPSGPGAFLTSPLLSFGAKLRVLSEPVRGRGPLADEEPTFEAFLARRIGREATRTLAGSFVRGVYAAEIEELGAKSAFPRLWSLVAEHGSLVRGMVKRMRARKGAPPMPGPQVRGSTLLSFPRGLRELPDALAAALGPRLRTRAPVAELERGAGRWTATLESGERLVADSVVLAIPAPAAHDLLAMAAPERLDPSALLAIEHASVTIVNLGLEGARLPQGFGFLVPPDEAGNPGAPRVLGTLFPSNVFDARAPLGCASATCIYRTSEEELDDEALVAGARADLARAIGSENTGAVRVSRVVRWTDVIPRYGVGHERRMRQLEGSLARALPGLLLAGAYVGGVSVEDCIARGREVARFLADRQAQGGAA